MIIFKQKLGNYLSELNLSLTNEQLRQIQHFHKFLYEENKKFNLTAIRDEDEAIIKHYCDSLLLATLPQLQASHKVLDVGTGAGFPGLPLAIALPQKQFALLDALQKRLKFLKAAQISLGITNITLWHGRAEDLGHDVKHREQYDCVVSRAVAELRVLLEYCLPFVRQGGFFIAQKGPEAEQEIIGAEMALEQLGGRIVARRSVNLAQRYQREIIIVQKTRNTSEKYPRRAGIPKKRPL